MKRLSILFFLVFLAGNALATHIVGGGFQYSRLSRNEYIFQLTLYFDAVNGSPNALDDDLRSFIFRKSDNRLMDSIDMPRIETNQFVPYTNPICAQGSGISTRIIIYRDNIHLSDSEYNDPQGYYLIWERCCRNATVTNIFIPGATGQTFYMEFPPVYKNGDEDINNSPVFQPITSDYPCINEAFYLSFNATDLDGDSLVFSMTNPLKGNSSPDTPRGIRPKSAPYDTVYWQQGFNANNAIAGAPSLQVNSKTGLLYCKPFQLGLFVFAVKCEEFRNGIKIGEVRREMQLLVKDCILNTAPTITIPNPSTGLSLKDKDTLVIETSSSRTCKILKLTDLQKDQTLRYRVITLNSQTPTYLRKDTSFSFRPGQDSVNLNFCVPACAVSPEGEPWKIALIVTDNGCSIPKSDTLEINLIAKRREILAPTIETVGIEQDTLQVVQTEVLSVPFHAIQSQNANIKTFSFLTDSAGNTVSSTQNGIQLPFGTGSGTLDTRFYWPEICFLPEKQPLKMTVVVEASECGVTRNDTLVKWLNISPKELNVQIGSSYSGAIPILFHEIGGLNFELVGSANDNRPIKLSADGSLKAVPGYSFPEVSGEGVIKSVFNFMSDCATPAGPFDVQFKASSLFCGKIYSDSVSYQLGFDYVIDSIGVIPNLITGDGNLKNDGLLMDDILVADNCNFHFDFVEIYNRWGNRVFHSKDRHFAWKPELKEEGVYFFALHFKEKTFRNWILVVR